VAAGRKTGGRQKGSVNKVTAEIKDMIAAALNNKGGVKYLEQQADENPTAFLTLVGKIVPMQLTAAHSVTMTDPVKAREEVDELFGVPRLVVNNG
jgi:hypothetical protein